MGTIPRKLSKITHVIQSPLGEIPYETHADKVKIKALIEILEKGIKENRIDTSKGFPKYDGATHEERATVNVLWAQVTQNLDILHTFLEKEAV
jgi:hypothetical protein